MGLPESIPLLMWSGLARIRDSNLATVAFLLAVQFWNPSLTFTDKHLKNYISKLQIQGGTEIHVEQAARLALKVSGFEVDVDDDLPNLKPARTMTREGVGLKDVLAGIVDISGHLEREPPAGWERKVLDSSLLAALETGSPPRSPEVPLLPSLPLLLFFF